MLPLIAFQDLVLILVVGLALGAIAGTWFGVWLAHAWARHHVHVPLPKEP